MPLLSTFELTKRYPGGVTALDGLTLDLEPGVIGLVGANGAGKSTFLKIMLGLLPPTSGSLTVLGIDATTRARALGFMPKHCSAISTWRARSRACRLSIDSRTKPVGVGCISASVGSFAAAISCSCAAVSARSTCCHRPYTRQ